MAATQREANVGRADAAAMLGLDEADIVLAPVWVNAGSEQLLIRLSSREAVLRARPVHALFTRHATLRPGRSIAYLWYQADGVATVRLFFEQQGRVIEDPGTGSACANLGGWCALNCVAPLSWRIEQGAAIPAPQRAVSGRGRKRQCTGRRQGTSGRRGGIYLALVPALSQNEGSRELPFFIWRFVAVALRIRPLPAGKAGRRGH